MRKAKDLKELVEKDMRQPWDRDSDEIAEMIDA